MGVGTQFAIGNGTAKVECVKIPISHVASEEDRVGAVQRQDLTDNIGDGIGIRAAEPLNTRGIGVDRDVLGVVECDDAIDVRIRCAIEGAHVEEGWRSVGSVRGEKFVQERCSAVEQDRFRSEEEIWVCGFGFLIAIELVLGYDGWVE